ncbi:MAG: ATP-binding protein [Minisyncoccales bacterium]
MIRDFLKISLFENVKSVSQKIKKTPKGYAFVFDKNKFCGLVTSNELSGQDSNRLIADIYIKKIKPISIDSQVEVAYQAFKKTNLDGLPVAEKKEEIIGLLLKDDLWSALIKELQISYQLLQKRYADLDILKELVQELGDSLKIDTVFNRLISALKKTMSPSANFSFIITPPDPAKPSNTMYMYATGTVGKTYLDSVKNDMVHSLELLPKEVSGNKDLMKWIHSEFNFEVLGGLRDDASTLTPSSFYSRPLMVSNELLGILNVSSGEPKLFIKQNVALIDTMAVATASTISRLRQLLESEQSRIASLVESLSNGLIMFDLNQRVTLSNPAAQKMTGLPAQGFYLSEFVKLFKEADIDKQIEQTLQTGNVAQVAEANLARFAYEIFITPVHDYEKKIIGGALLLHDITHLKEIDRMKTEFVSVASHQLRTPLTAIKLFIEMLASEEVGKLNASQKDYISNVGESTERMIKLVNDLLNISRLDTGRLRIEPKTVQIRDFIQKIIDEFVLSDKKECNPKIVFRKPKGKLSTIQVDPDLMRQVISNLITNAVRYSPKDRCNIVVVLKKRGEKDYLISVRDSGIGISKEVQPKIFEKFFRADDAIKLTTEGTGLGLYTVKKIIESSGGKVWFESKGKNQGSTFYISLPIMGMKVKK